MKEYMLTDYYGRKEQLMAEITEFLNYKFNLITISFKDGLFSISGEDKHQQLKCYKMLTEVINKI